MRTRLACACSARCCAPRTESTQGSETCFARHVVLATGREGTGGRLCPDFRRCDSRAADHARSSIPLTTSTSHGLPGDALPSWAPMRRHSTTPPTRSRAGAEAVAMFCRRPFLPQVNKARWMGFSGFQNGFPALDYASRRRLDATLARCRCRRPTSSSRRCTRHKDFHYILPSPGRTSLPARRRYRRHREAGGETYDAAIFATGFAVDPSSCPELAAFRDSILLWGDRVGATEAGRNPVAARFPYLGLGFEFTERVPGLCPSLSRSACHQLWRREGRALAGDIPGLNPAVMQVRAIDQPRHFRRRFRAPLPGDDRVRRSRAGADAVLRPRQDRGAAVGG